jgi:hypothetical protein
MKNETGNSEEARAYDNKHLRTSMGEINGTVTIHFEHVPEKLFIPIIAMIHEVEMRITSLVEGKDIQAQITQEEQSILEKNRLNAATKNLNNIKSHAWRDDEKRVVSESPDKHIAWERYKKAFPGQRSPNAIHQRWLGAQRQKKRKKEDAQQITQQPESTPAVSPPPSHETPVVAIEHPPGEPQTPSIISTNQPWPSIGSAVILLKQPRTGEVGKIKNIVDEKVCVETEAGEIVWSEKGEYGMTDRVPKDPPPKIEKSIKWTEKWPDEEIKCLEKIMDGRVATIQFRKAFPASTKPHQAINGKWRAIHKPKKESPAPLPHHIHPDKTEETNSKEPSQPSTFLPSDGIITGCHVKQVRGSCRFFGNGVVKRINQKSGEILVQFNNGVEWISRDKCELVKPDGE